MKKTLIMISLCALLFGCTKDWGVPTTRNYPINGAFTELDVSNAFQVTVSDQVTDVVVTVDDMAHEKVVVKVVNGKLQIGFKPDTWYNGTKAVAVIPATDNLRGIELSGASSFTGNLNGHDVDIDLSGASHYQGSVDADEIDLDLSGASKAVMSGFCLEKMDVDISGASTLNASLLETPSVFGDISGASTADVTICSNLKVNLSGASTLIYGLISPDCNPVIDCPCSGASIVRPR
ncbi:MAG: DUF2807 domain-containing protein [Bacteroidales bacterium]|nr:DUF2807 domain-containing protein [Bacteroidales bacterium]